MSAQPSMLAPGLLQSAALAQPCWAAASYHRETHVVAAVHGYMQWGRGEQRHGLAERENDNS